MSALRVLSAICVSGLITLASGCALSGREKVDKATPLSPRDREQVVRRFEENRDHAQFRAALARWNAHDVSGCETTLRQLLARNNSHLEAVILWTELQIELEQPNRALPLVEALCDQGADDPRLMQARGLLLAALDRPDEAETWLARGAGLPEDNAGDEELTQKELADDRLGGEEYDESELDEESSLAASGDRSPDLAGDSGDEQVALVGSDLDLPVAELASDEASSDEQLAYDHVTGDRLADETLADGDNAPLPHDLSVDEFEPSDRDNATSDDAELAQIVFESRECRGGSECSDGAPRTPCTLRKDCAEGKRTVARAEKLLKAGAAKSAQSVLVDMLRDHPRDDSLAVTAIVMALRNDAPQLALAVGRKAAELHAKSPALFRAMATCHLSVGDYDASEVALQQSLSLDSHSALTYFLMGRTLDGLGRTAEADRSYREASALDARLADRR